MAGNIVEIIIAAKDLTAAAFNTTKAKLVALKTNVAGAKTNFSNLGSKITSVMSAAIVPIMLVVAAVYSIGKAVGTIIKDFGELDTTMKGVQKTTGMTDAEIEVLEGEFKGMSKTIPLSANELAKIGVIAGQLGIEGAENIRSFTQTVAESSVAFSMDAEATALGLQALVKIYDKSIPEAVNLASAVNVLGNTTGASEAQLLEFATTLGPTAEMMGFNAAEALGMGATLISMKIDASDAGTRINAMLTQMGQHLPKVAETLGITEQAFKDAFAKDAMDTLMLLIDKLKEIEDPIDRNTTATQIFGRVGAKAFKGLMKGSEVLGENIDNATVGLEEGTAVHEEYLIFASSFESQMDLIGNKINLVSVALGETLAPAILALGGALTDTLIPMFAAFTGEIEKQTSDVWPKFTTAVNEAFTKITGGVEFGDLMQDLGVIVGTVLGGILTAATFLIDALGPLWTAIGGIVGVRADIVGLVADIIDIGFVPAITKALDDLATNIGDKITPIVTAIETAFSLATGAVGTVFDAIRDTAIYAKLSAITTDIGSKIATIVSAMGTAFDLAKGKVGLIFDAIKDSEIYAKLSEIASAIGTKVAPITTAVKTAFDALKGVVGTVFDTIKDTEIYGKLETIAAGVGAKVLPIITAVITAFTNLPSQIGAIFVLVGEEITAFGEKMPGFVGTGITGIGDAFAGIGANLDSESIKASLAEIGGSIDTNIITPLGINVGTAVEAAQLAMNAGTLLMTGCLGPVGTAIATMGDSWDDIPATIDKVAVATEKLKEDVEADMDSITVDVDGTQVTFSGLEGKIGDVVTEFTNFEAIAGELIGLDWSVFTTLKDELPGIDEGIGDMKNAFGELKTVLDDNIDNLADIQTDLGDIEAAITPFVDGIAPGIKAIGNFGTALSDTQSALSTFASMSTVDIDGMLGFEGAVHSMVMGLEILEGQIGRLIPTFGDITSLIRSISETFVYSGGRSSELTDHIYDLNTAFQDEAEAVHAARFALRDYLQALSYTGEGHEANVASYKLTEKYMGRFARGTEDATDIINDFLHEEIVLETGLNTTTRALKFQTSQLTKISDAIQPLINFMGTLNELYESVFGEKAAVWDAFKVQEVFEAIEDTISFMGEALGKLDFGTLVGEALDNSKDFRASMVEDGSQLNILTNYIDILLGNYVQLAELMGRLAEAEDDMGDEAFEVSQAFAGISDYVQGLNTYLPTLASELGTLNDLWGESGETIDDSMASYHRLMSVVKSITLSYADFMGTIMELSLARDTAATLGADLSASFEMVVEFVSELAGVIPSLATELNTLGDIWKENEEAVSKGAAAFGKAIKPIETISDGMLDFGNVMVVAGDDISGKFDAITDYIGKLTDFTPLLSLALSGLKTVWDENSDSINGGISAFNEVMAAITNVKIYMDEWVSAELDAKTATEEATAAVTAEATALADPLVTALATALDSTGTLNEATGTLAGALDALIPSVTNAADAITDSFTVAASNAAATLSSLSGSAYGWGSSLMGSFVDGLYSQMGAIVGAMAEAAGIVNSYIGVASPTELGPLRELESFAPNLMRTFQEGIESGMPALNKTLGGLSLGGASVGAGMVSGGGSVKNVYMTINQNIGSREDARYSVTEIERLMRKPAIV